MPGGLAVGVPAPAGPSATGPTVTSLWWGVGSPPGLRRGPRDRVPAPSCRRSRGSESYDAWPRLLQTAVVSMALSEHRKATVGPGGTGATRVRGVRGRWGVGRAGSGLRDHVCRLHREPRPHRAGALLEVSPSCPCAVWGPRPAGSESEMSPESQWSGSSAVRDPGGRGAHGRPGLAGGCGSAGVPTKTQLGSPPAPHAPAVSPHPAGGGARHEPAPPRGGRERGFWVTSAPAGVPAEVRAMEACGGAGGPLRRRPGEKVPPSEGGPPAVSVGHCVRPPSRTA